MRHSYIYLNCSLIQAEQNELQDRIIEMDQQDRALVQPPTNASQQRIQKKQLNWRTILYDQKIFIDSQSFRKWDGNLQFEGQALLQKDLARTRSSESHFQNPKTKNQLRRIATFYCKNNNTLYQQGLLQIIIPFSLLHKKDFPTRKCYSYFNAFMRKHFPKLLTQKMIQSKRQLPHAVLAIDLTKVLLKFHYPRIYSIFMRDQIPISMIVTQQLLTVFAKSVRIEFVYEIIDYFIRKNNQNYILYMCVALIGIQKKKICQMQEEKLHNFVNRHLKEINNHQDLELWFQQTNRLGEKTPNSFEDHSCRLGLTDKSVLSQQDLKGMMKCQNYFIDNLLPISSDQAEQKLEKYFFVYYSAKLPKRYHTIQLKPIKQISKTVLERLQKLPKDTIIVLAISHQNEETQIELFKSFSQKVGQFEGYTHSIAILTQRYEVHSKCSIY